MAKIILVEDHEELREALATLLGMAGHCLEALGSGAEYRRKMAKESFDLAIIDIGLPDVSGYTLAEETRSRFSTKVIILTALDSLDDRIRGYNSGGQVYLTKPVAHDELLAVIASLTRPEKESPSGHPPVAPAGSWLLDVSAWQLYDPLGTAIKLTAKEWQFLRILLDIKEKESNRSEIISRLYPREDACTSRALDSLVRRLRNKIRQESTSEFPLKTSYSQGYYFSKSLKERS